MPGDTFQPRCRRSRGFTLLELILVLVVLAVIVAMTIPSMRGLAQGRGVESCSGQLLSLAHYARSQAIAEGTTYRLYVDPDQRMYYLARQDGPEFFPLGTEFGRMFTVPDDVQLEWDESYVSQQLQVASETGKLIPEREATAVPYVDFRASGRTDPCLIRLTDRTGEVTQLVCPSATEMMRMVLPDGTVRY